MSGTKPWKTPCQADFLTCLPPGVNSKPGGLRGGGAEDPGPEGHPVSQQILTELLLRTSISAG